MTPQKAIDGCRGQDRICQKWVFDKWSEAMLMLCMRYVKKLPDAEEMMLNGFFNFYRSIDRFVYTDERSISAWLKKIMVNECLMFLRRKGELKIVEEKHAIDVGANETFTTKMAADELYRLVLDLPAGYRTIFNLYVVEGFSHKEIAAMLGISEGASKSQLSKARESLRNTITRNANKQIP